MLKIRLINFSKQYLADEYYFSSVFHTKSNKVMMKAWKGLMTDPRLWVFISVRHIWLNSKNGIATGRYPLKTHNTLFKNQGASEVLRMIPSFFFGRFSIFFSSHWFVSEYLLLLFLINGQDPSDCLLLTFHCLWDVRDLITRIIPLIPPYTTYLKLLTQIFLANVFCSK